MATNLNLIGVNLAGAEFSPPNGSFYEYPTQAEIDYEAFKGMSVIRVPVEWERLQPSLGGALDPSQLSSLDGVVDRATQDGLRVVIDLHNYGKYDGNLIGGSSVSNAQFADFWQKMASHYSSNPNVIYGLMNEPAQTDARGWLASVNAAIDAIRYDSVDGAKTPLSNQEILVPGIDYDHADTWVGSDNANVIGAGIVDPLRNYAFDVHQYLDSDGSGTHYGPVADADGTDKVSAITAWARATQQKLFLGEIGVPSDPTSLQALDNVLGYLNQNPDVWQGAAYWAAGPLWKTVTQDGQSTDYPLSAEPTADPGNTANHGYDDKPQQTVLDKYAHQTDVAAIAITAPTNGADTRVAAIAGTGADGSTVSVTIAPKGGGNATTGSVLVTGGTWTYTPPDALPDGAYTVSASQQTSGTGPAKTASGTFTLDTTAPIVASPALTVFQNSGPTPIGILAPSDNLTAAGNLSIRAISLPTDGIVTLADGTTPITAAQTLTAAQLQSLEFTPTPGVIDQASTFGYLVTDGAGNSATGTAALRVAAAAAPVITGTHATTSMAETSVKPFTGVTIADGNASPMDSLVITLTSGAGTLTGSGLTVVSADSYGLAATDPTTLTNELQALAFVPANGTPGATVVSKFRLVDRTVAGPTTTDDETSVTDTAATVTITPPDPTPNRPTSDVSTAVDPATASPPPASITAPTDPTPARGTAPDPTPSLTLSAPDVVTISPHVSFDHGVFTLSGTASSAAGITDVEITATLGNGVVKDLGAAEVDGQGAFTFKDRIGLRTQGFITATATDSAGGMASNTAGYSLMGGLQQGGVTAEQDIYTDDGISLLSTSRFRPDGSHTTDVMALGQTLNSDQTISFDERSQGYNTFVYDPGHGHNIVDHFRLRGERHDTLSFSGDEFGNSIANVLRHSYDAKDGGGVVIVDPISHDTVKLLNISKEQLARNRGDIKFNV